MDYLGLDDDERVIAETAAAFAEKRLAPYALEWDATKHFPTDALREAAELGMAAIYCSEEVGGSGLRRLDAVRIFEHLSAADPTTAAFLSIHNMCAWMVDTYGTGRIADAKITRLVRDHFKLTPKGIIDDLDLRRPIYRKTAAFGHFGRNEDGFTWEKTDRANALRKAAGL